MALTPVVGLEHTGAYMNRCGMARRVVRIVIVLSFISVSFGLARGTAQDSQAQEPKSNAPASEGRTEGSKYSGMYMFLKEGEFVQVSVEDAGRVTGFISRYGNGESDKGAFLDQFFKSGRLEGNKLSFTTETVHGVSFDFKGLVERGEGKNPGDEGYYVLKGNLTENTADVNKKVSSRTMNVVFKVFPQNAGPAAAGRK